MKVLFVAFVAVVAAPGSAVVSEKKGCCSLLAVAVIHWL